MWQSKAIAVAALSALAVSTPALAGGGRHLDDEYYVSADVVRVEPVVRIVQVASPREVCWKEKVRHVSHPRWHRHRHHHRRNHHSPLPMIVGGVVGGVVGNQIGKGGGRDALTIAGTLIGAAVGHSVQHAPRHHHRPRHSYTTVERRCEVQTDYYDEERIDGYDVTYRYQGRHFTTRMDHDPGDRIRLRVQVEPTVEYERVTRVEEAYLSRRSQM